MAANPTQSGTAGQEATGGSEAGGPTASTGDGRANASVAPRARSAPRCRLGLDARLRRPSARRGACAQLGTRQGAHASHRAGSVARRDQVNEDRTDPNRPGAGPAGLDLAEWRLACRRPCAYALVFPAHDGGLMESRRLGQLAQPRLRAGGSSCWFCEDPSLRSAPQLLLAAHPRRRDGRGGCPPARPFAADGPQHLRACFRRATGRRALVRRRTDPASAVQARVRSVSASRRGEITENAGSESPCKETMGGTGFEPVTSCL